MGTLEPINEMDKKEFEGEEGEPTKIDVVLKYLRNVVAIFIIVGLVYISGIYQTFLYSGTSPSISQESITSELDAEILTIPINIYIFKNNETLGSNKSKEDVRRVVENASRVWNQAGVHIKVLEINDIIASDSEINLFFDDVGSLMESISGYDSRAVNVFFRKSLGGINGLAYTGLGIIYVADLTTVYDFRVLAHEIGHILGLEHIDTDGRRLMYRGANGFNLTMDEIERARSFIIN